MEQKIVSSESKTLLEKVETLSSRLIRFATGGAWNEDPTYKQLRSELIANPRVKAKLPSFILKCRDIGAFWSFIKAEFSTYEGRRQYLRAEFEPLLSMLESQATFPEQNISGAIAVLDSEHIADAWSKALDRRSTDAEGAITAARTLLESVCKHLLDARGIAYAETDDLPRLYGMTAEQLNLAPNQHTEQIFKQILGNCQSVVQGLGALRNRLSDAHGKGKLAARPAPRHAELAVNLAGTMATFLVSTWQARKASP
jgi:hypothetical protein